MTSSVCQGISDSGGKDVGAADVGAADFGADESVVGLDASEQPTVAVATLVSHDAFVAAGAPSVCDGQGCVSTRHVDL